jgi:FkbM family methyltransferase
MKAAVRAILRKTAPKLLYGYQLHRTHREPEISLLPTFCRSDAISIDVGANKGLYSYYMLPHSSAVVAFEPLPVMQERLRTHFENRITLYPVALSDRDGEAEIRLPKGNPSWATIDPHNLLSLAGDVEMEVVKVVTRRLDNYEFTDIGFMKIDVEGHEEAVLRGAVETITRTQPTLLIEIEERHNAGSIQRTASFLEGLGYRGYFLDNGRLHPLRDFDLPKDQPIQNVAVSGKVGRYINNFIFTAYDLAA